MLNKLIPGFVKEQDYLRTLSTAGYTIGFRYNMERSPILVNTFPRRWQTRWNEQKYLFRDPVVLWFNTTVGVRRWSEIPLADPYGVMDDAKRFGLAYGAVVSIHKEDECNWITVSRSDRELTDTELAVLAAKFEGWTDSLYANIVVLEPEEVRVLQGFAKGLDRAAIAAEQEVSVSTVKLRLASASKKLGAKSRSEAVDLARTMYLL